MVSPIRYYLPQYYAAEKELAFLLSRFRKHHHDPIPWEQNGASLFDEQKLAAAMAATYGLSLLYGVPGSGKTYTIQRIVKSFDDSGMHGLVVSPTGQASKRAKQMILSAGDQLHNQPDCLTTYRALGYNPGLDRFAFNEDNPLDIDYLLIDESSFLGTLHARDLYLAIDPKRTRVISVGDPFQLPSVEPGNVYNDMINSGHFPSAPLRISRRQGRDSGITFNANRILNGLAPSSIDPKTGERFVDWFFTPLLEEDKIHSKLIMWVKDQIPDRYKLDPIADIQVISPGKKGVAGTFELNKLLQPVLNPPRATMTPKYRNFTVGDKVINKNNNRALCIVNGDTGIVRETGESGMIVDFGEGAGPDGTGILEIAKATADHVHLNFAQTAHSTQGSEYPCQVSPLYRMHWRLMSRNLLYTIDTRPKKLSFQFGDNSALMRCIEHSETLERITGLQHAIEGYVA